MMIEGLHHIALLASQREKTLAFYSALGFRAESSHIRPQRQDEIIFMTQKGVCLEIFVSAQHPARVTEPEAYGLRHLAFRVACAEEVRKALLRDGFLPEALRVDSFNGKPMFFVKDPDGQPIEIHE